MQSAIFFFERSRVAAGAFLRRARGLTRCNQRQRFIQHGQTELNQFVLQGQGREHPKKIIEAVLDELKGFETEDDITMVVVRKE